MTHALALLASMILCGCGGGGILRSTTDFPSGRGFVSHEITVDGRTHQLWMFIPESYDGESRYPAIVFLHGLFEAGSESSRALTAGLGPVIARDPRHWPFIVLFPQSDGTWRGDARERQVLGSLDFAMTRYAIDPDRVVLAGLSYGGLGVWQIGSRNAGRFAAVVSVSGKKDVAAAAGLRDVPVWAFHSRGDPFVGVANSQEMCESIDRIGGDVRLTVFPAVDHDCWDRAVAESSLLDWMLDQRRTVHATLSPD